MGGCESPTSRVMESFSHDISLSRWSRALDRPARQLALCQLSQTLPEGMDSWNLIRKQNKEKQFQILQHRMMQVRNTTQH